MTPITPEELARATGLSVRMIHRIGKRDTWSGLPINVIESFRAAVGVTFATEAMQVKYLLRSLKGSARPLRHVHKLSPKDRRNLIR